MRAVLLCRSKWEFPYSINCTISNSGKTKVSKHYSFSLGDRHIVSQPGQYLPVMAPLVIQFQLLRKLLSAKLVPGLVLACICIMKIKWPVFKLPNFCFGWMWCCIGSFSLMWIEVDNRWLSCTLIKHCQVLWKTQLYLCFFMRIRMRMWNQVSLIAQVHLWL